MSIRSNSEIIIELHLLTNQLISLENENLKFININRSQTIKNIIIYAKNLIALLKNYKKIFEELMFKLPDMLGNIDIGVVKQHISNIIITIENIITINNQGNRGVNESNILEISREIIYLTNINVYNAKRSVARVINTIQSSISSSLDLLPPIPSNPHAPGLSRQRAIGRPSLNILSLPPPPPPTSLASSSDEEGFGLKYRKKRSNKRANYTKNYTKRRETRSSKMKKRATKARSSRLF
jgi:hypothetical protein